MYEITFGTNENNNNVSISSGGKLLKEWQGAFAQLITNEILVKLSEHNTPLAMCRIHANVLLWHISKLYHSTIVNKKIHNSLEPLKLSSDKNNMAEVLLLQIRLSDEPISDEKLLSVFLNEFPNRNFLKYYELIEQLISRRLIEKEVNAERIYYKNFSQAEQSPVPPEVKKAVLQR